MRVKNTMKKDMFDMKAVIITVATGLILITLASCTPVSLYNVYMKYEPTAIGIHQQRHSNIPITVALFNDGRDEKDNTFVGRVVKEDGSHIPVYGLAIKPAEAISAGIRRFLAELGYNVVPSSPLWNLNEKSIDKTWGKAVVGGTIEEFEVVCQKQGLMKEYTATIKLNVVIADVDQSKVIYKVVVKTGPTLKHVKFSEKMLEQQLNKALSEAIERVFESDEIHQKLDDMVKI